VDRVDLLLHPVRLRILQAFLGDRALTTSQLAAELPEVPQASLYRHIAQLSRAGVLQVVAERRVRGALERTYVLRGAAAQVGPAEAARMTPEERLRGFTAFVASLLGAAERSLDAPGRGRQPDQLGYRMAGLWLTDAELTELLADLVRVLQPRLANPPGGRRRRWLVAGVLLPADGGKAGTGNGSGRQGPTGPRATAAPRRSPGRRTRRAGPEGPAV
jgi:hypothetical protein